MTGLLPFDYDDSLWVLDDRGYRCMRHTTVPDPTHEALVRFWNGVWWVRCEGSTTTIGDFFAAIEWACAVLERGETLQLRVGPDVPEGQAP